MKLLPDINRFGPLSVLKHGQKHMKTRSIGRRGCEAQRAGQAGYRGAVPAGHQCATPAGYWGATPAGSLHPMITGFGAGTANRPGVCMGEFLFGYRRPGGQCTHISTFATQKRARFPDLGGIENVCPRWPVGGPERSPWLCIWGGP